MLETYRTWFFNGAILVGALILIGGLTLVNILLGHTSVLYSSILMLCALPFILFSSILAIKFREIPRFGNFPIKGNWAVFQGYLGVFLCSAGEIYFFYTLIQNLK